jgi:arabinofuranosyltransferase
MRPVTTQRTVGVIGWVFPNVAVIDADGLNDYIIARTPVKVSNDERLMAHDRYPPPGYMECFRSNFHVGPDFKEYTRPQQLTDDDIRECERKFALN